MLIKIANGVCAERQVCFPHVKTHECIQKWKINQFFFWMDFVVSVLLRVDFLSGHIDQVPWSYMKSLLRLQLLTHYKCEYDHLFTFVPCNQIIYFNGQAMALKYRCWPDSSSSLLLPWSDLFRPNIAFYSVARYTGEDKSILNCLDPISMHIFSVVARTWRDTGQLTIISTWE